MLNDLKNFNAQRMELTELVALSAFTRTLLAEFEELGVEPPEEWIEENFKSLRREIKTRNANRLSAKLKSAEARLENLKTPSEKRTETAAEITKLKKMLAGA